MKHYYGYDYKDIAKMTKVKVGTVKSRVHYGLENLRKELRTDDR
ncbi:sigma factor-like helix-turn-helix DNA-binding protein [Halobacillus trueperi]|nr:sigma factor-like helix-turn-helix DNA-binding protein [Halobacillus trueperi]